MNRWTNIYSQYLIDWLVEGVAVFEYYAIHMTSLNFYIGLSLYVGAMQSDLEIQLEKIHRNINNSSGLIDRHFGRSLINEIRFHARLYE